MSGIKVDWNVRENWYRETPERVVNIIAYNGETGHCVSVNLTNAEARQLTKSFSAMESKVIKLDDQIRKRKEKAKAKEVARRAREAEKKAAKKKAKEA